MSPLMEKMGNLVNELERAVSICNTCQTCLSRCPETRWGEEIKQEIMETVQALECELAQVSRLLYNEQHNRPS